MGHSDSTLLTHGVDVEMWRTPATDSRISPGWPADDKPIAMFWGLIDERLDHGWVASLCIDSSCRFVLAGPKANDLPGGYVDHGGHPMLISPEPIELGRIALGDLPAHAASAQVLVMPYIDAPVTRAMQPLKLKEYLATMKPVVVRDLPATRDWADCCDLASSAEQFVALVMERAKTGTPALWEAGSDNQIAPADRRIRQPADGMVVSSQGAREVKARRMVMEMLLADQPKQDVAHDKSAHLWDMAAQQGVDESRFASRRSALEAVNDYFRKRESSDQINAMDSFYDAAYSLISSPEARDAFDLESPLSIA